MVDRRINRRINKNRVKKYTTSKKSRNEQYLNDLKINKKSSRRISKNKIFNNLLAVKNIKNQVIFHISAVKKIIMSQGGIFTSTKEERHKENIRKAFHFCGLIIPLMILLLSQKVSILILLCILIPVLIADYNNFAIRYKNIPYSNVLLQLFREEELVKGKLSGFSWLLIGLLLSIVAFDKYLVALSMSILIVGDACAALIGKNFGKIKLCGSKTFEGTFAFIVFGSITALVCTEYVFNQSNFLKDVIEYTNFDSLFVCFAVVVASIVELTSKSIEIDDNFAVPLSFCLTYDILMILCK